MNIPFMDLSKTFIENEDDFKSDLSRVLTHGRMIDGIELESFESLMEERFSLKAIAVQSGTSALYLALKSLGVGQGDEVIIPCMSWISTAHAVTELGASAVFCDIENDLNISVDSISELITPNTKAIIPVHFMGKISEMKKIAQLGKEYNIKIIEDASQAFASTYFDYPVGKFSDICCISLNPMKLFGAPGEGGLILCKDESIYGELRSLRYCGMDSHQSSLNFRMPSLTAAFLISRYKSLNQIIKKRTLLEQRYRNELSSKVIIQKKGDNRISVLYGLTLFEDKRDLLIEHLSQHSIETKIQHEPLMCNHEMYKNHRNNIKIGLSLEKKILNIPFNETLLDSEVSYIITKVNEFYDE